MITMDLYNSYSEEEIQNFFDHFMKSSGNLSYLRKLYGLAHSKFKSSIPDEVIIALESTLCDNLISHGVRDVCASILQSILPRNSAISYEDLSQELPEERKFSILMLLLAVQSEKTQNRNEFCKLLLRSLNSRDSSLNMKMSALKLFTQIVSSDVKELIIDVDTIAKFLILCLGPISKASITLKRRDKVVEMDGSSATEMFTLLTLTDNITEEFQLAIQSFSILNQIRPVIFNQTSKSSLISDLEDTVTKYCYRIIEQAKIIPIRPEDSAFQRVALIEAIVLLDHLILGQVHLTKSSQIFGVATTLLTNYSDVEIGIPVLQLIIDLNIDSSITANKLEIFFNDNVTSALHNVCSSGEIIIFLTKNLEYFNSLPNSPLRKWYPNILKILAWYPVTFEEDFETLIAAFMDENTSIDVFNSILDLPCITMSLIYANEPSSINKKEFTNVNRSLIQYTLKKVHQINENLKIKDLYNLLKSCASHPRVIAAVAIVPDLLRNCLEVLLIYGDSCLVQNVLKIILQRATNDDLQNEEVEANELEKIFIDTALHCFRIYPQLIIDLKSDILTFFQLVTNPSRAICISMIWIVGQYSPSIVTENSNESFITVLYDALECLIYEHINMVTPMTVSVLVTALCKISKSQHDIIPRVRLLLTKLRQHSKSQEKIDEWTSANSKLDEALHVHSNNYTEDNFSIETLIRFMKVITEDSSTDGDSNNGFYRYSSNS